MVLRFPKMFLRLAESVGVAARLAACRNAGPDHEGICPMASRWRAPVAIIRDLARPLRAVV